LKKSQTEENKKGLEGVNKLINKLSIKRQERVEVKEEEKIQED
jgi:hypothetical protein